MSGSIPRRIGAWSFCSAPSLQLDWNRPDVHKAATWAELFVDLAFVAANIKLSDALKSDLTWAGFGRFVSMFCLFFDLWSALTFYTTRFFEEGKLMHQLVYVSMLGSIVFMAIPVGDLGLADSGRRLAGSESTPAYNNTYDAADTLVLWFSVASCFGASVLSISNLAISCLIPRARVVGMANALSYGIAAILTGAAAATDIYAAPWLWISSSLVMKLGPTLSSFLPRRYSLPIHIEHVAERFALFLMLVLGEGVISLVLPSIQDATLHIPFVVAALLLLWMLREAYYSGQPFQAKHHAMRRKRSAGRLFIHAHLPLTLGALVTGVALKSELAHVAQKLSQAESWLLAVGVCFFLVWTSMIRISHRGLSRELGICKYGRDAQSRRVAQAAAKVKSDGSPVPTAGGTPAKRGVETVSSQMDQPKDLGTIAVKAGQTGRMPSTETETETETETGKEEEASVPNPEDSDAHARSSMSDDNTDSDGGDDIPAHLLPGMSAPVSADSSRSSSETVAAAATTAKATATATATAGEETDEESAQDVLATKSRGAAALAALAGDSTMLQVHPSRAGWEDAYAVGWDKTGTDDNMVVAAVPVADGVAGVVVVVGELDGPVSGSANTSEAPAGKSAQTSESHGAGMDSAVDLEMSAACCGHPPSLEAGKQRRRLVWAARLLFALAPLLIPMLSNGSAIAEVLVMTAIVVAYVCTDMFDVLGWRGTAHPSPDHDHPRDEQLDSAGTISGPKDAGKSLPRVKSRVGWGQLRVGGETSATGTSQLGPRARKMRKHATRHSNRSRRASEQWHDDDADDDADADDDDDEQVDKPVPTASSRETDSAAGDEDGDDDDHLFRFGIDTHGTCPTTNSTFYIPSPVCSI